MRYVIKKTSVSTKLNVYSLKYKFAVLNCTVRNSSTIMVHTKLKLIAPLSFVKLRIIYSSSPVCTRNVSQKNNINDANAAETVPHAKMHHACTWATFVSIQKGSILRFSLFFLFFSLHLNLCFFIYIYNILI